MGLEDYCDPEKLAEAIEERKKAKSSSGEEEGTLTVPEEPVQKDYMSATATIPTETSTYATPSVALEGKKTDKGKGKDKPLHLRMSVFFGTDPF